MKVYINDKLTDVGASGVLSEVLEGIAMAGNERRKGIAVAVNDQVITRADWQHFKLEENARIVIITATQGG